MISRRTTVSAAALLFASAGAAAAFPAVATSDLNVRSGPGTGFRIIDQLDEGQNVEVTARSGGWYQIDGQGWANAAFFEGAGSAALEDRYIVADYPRAYGTPLFFYGSDPFFWDDAGFYWFWRDGRRHRVGWDWFRDRDYRRDFRWSNARFRDDFERRRMDFDRSASRGDREFLGGEGRADVESDRVPSPRSQGSAQFEEERVQRMREGRASSVEGEAPRRIQPEPRGSGIEGRPRGGQQPQEGPPLLERNLPSGGY